MKNLRIALESVVKILQTGTPGGKGGELMATMVSTESNGFKISARDAINCAVMELWLSPDGHESDEVNIALPIVEFTKAVKSFEKKDVTYFKFEEGFIVLSDTPDDFVRNANRIRLLDERYTNEVSLVIPYDDINSCILDSKSFFTAFKEVRASDPPYVVWTKEGSDLAISAGSEAMSSSRRTVEVVPFEDAHPPENMRMAMNTIYLDCLAKLGERMRISFDNDSPMIMVVKELGVILKYTFTVRIEDE